MSSFSYLTLIIAQITTLQSLSCTSKTSTECNIDCNQNQICKNQILTCNADLDCHIGCNGFQNSKTQLKMDNDCCYGSTIYCPLNKDCFFDCSEGCNNIIIHAKDSNHLYISNCNSQHYYTNMTVFCPQNIHRETLNPICTIDGHNIQSTNIYTKQGFNDLQLTNSKSIIDTHVYCGKNTEYNCEVNEDGNGCTIDNNICNNLILTTNPITTSEVNYMRFYCYYSSDDPFEDNTFNVTHFINVFRNAILSAFHDVFIPSISGSIEDFHICEVFVDYIRYTDILNIIPVLGPNNCPFVNPPFVEFYGGQYYAAANFKIYANPNDLKAFGEEIISAFYTDKFLTLINDYYHPIYGSLGIKIRANNGIYVFNLNQTKIPTEYPSMFPSKSPIYSTSNIESETSESEQFLTVIVAHSTVTVATLWIILGICILYYLRISHCIDKDSVDGNITNNDMKHNDTMASLPLLSENKTITIIKAEEKHSANFIERENITDEIYENITKINELETLENIKQYIKIVQNCK